MARKGRSTEEIIAALREADVRIGQGETVGKICRSLGVSEQTYYKWRREYGGLKLDQAKRLKELERENDRLKRAVSELTLDKLILKEALSGPEGQRSKNTEPFPQAGVRGSRALAASRIGASRVCGRWTSTRNATANAAS
jgi:transposase-like protein